MDKRDWLRVAQDSFNNGIDMSSVDTIAKKYEGNTDAEDADTAEAELGKSTKLIDDLIAAQ